MPRYVPEGRANGRQHRLPGNINARQVLSATVVGQRQGLGKWQSVNVRRAWRAVPLGSDRFAFLAPSIEVSSGAKLLLVAKLIQVQNACHFEPRVQACAQMPVLRCL